MSALTSQYRGFFLETRASFNGREYSGSFLIESMEHDGRRVEQSVGSFPLEAAAHGTAQLHAIHEVDKLADKQEIPATSDCSVSQLPP